MTTRKAQGASMDNAVLHFDLHCPAPRGFAYVGASRVRSAAGLFYFGKVRRSDWLPVNGPGKPIEQVERSYESDDTETDSDGESNRDEASSAASESDHGDRWLGDPTEIAAFERCTEDANDGPIPSKTSLILKGGAMSHPLEGFKSRQINGFERGEIWATPGRLQKA